MSLSTLKPVASCQISPPTGAKEARSQELRVSMMQRRALPPLQCSVSDSCLGEHQKAHILKHSSEILEQKVQHICLRMPGKRYCDPILDRPCQLNVKQKEKPLLQERFNTSPSRRELFHLTATSLSLLSLVSPAYAADAQIKNASILEKIIEKFNEFTGSSKPKEETEEKKPKGEAKDTTKLKVKDEAEKKNNNGGEEKKPSTNTPVPPIEKPTVPAPPSTINGKTVETSALP